MAQKKKDYARLNCKIDKEKEMYRKIIAIVFVATIVFTSGCGTNNKASNAKTNINTSVIEKDDDYIAPGVYHDDPDNDEDDSVYYDVFEKAQSSEFLEKYNYAAMFADTFACDTIVLLQVPNGMDGESDEYLQEGIELYSKEKNDKGNAKTKVFYNSRYYESEEPSEEEIKKDIFESYIDPENDDGTLNTDIAFGSFEHNGKTVWYTYKRTRTFDSDTLTDLANKHEEQDYYFYQDVGTGTNYKVLIIVSNNCRCDEKDNIIENEMTLDDAKKFLIDV